MMPELPDKMQKTIIKCKLQKKMLKHLLTFSLNKYFNISYLYKQVIYNFIQKKLEIS